MKHTYKDIAQDFSWTMDEDNLCWFDGLPKGWSDVIYDYIVKLDRVLKQYNLVQCLSIVQTKEKFGGLRYYYDFIPTNESFSFTKEQLKGMKIYDSIVYDMEYATETVCCDCGTTENIECYGGWVHFACPQCEAKRVAEWEKVQEKWKKVRGV